MRKLVLILIAFIAMVTFIRAFDSTGEKVAVPVEVGTISENPVEFTTK
jgi:hypothetical protein